MNTLAWLNPARWMLYLALSAALWLGYHHWAKHQQEIGYQRAVDEYAAQAKKIDEKREAVAEPIVQHDIQVVEKIRTVTKTITKEVTVYVPSDSCPLPGGFRVLHDAAANGEVPDTSRIPDAAAVPSQDAASTISENYGTCHETAQRLIDLQTWIRAQQNLN